MITTGILYIIYVFVLGITSLLSTLGDVSLPVEMIAGLNSLGPAYMALDVIFPIGVLISIIAFEIVFDTILLTYKLIKWGYTKIPGIG